MNWIISLQCDIKLVMVLWRLSAFTHTRSPFSPISKPNENTLHTVLNCALTAHIAWCFVEEPWEMKTVDPVHRRPELFPPHSSLMSNRMIPFKKYKHFQMVRRGEFFPFSKSRNSIFYSTISHESHTQSIIYGHLWHFCRAYNSLYILRWIWGSWNTCGLCM